MRRVVVALVVAATLSVPAVAAAPIASNANASRAIQAYRAMQRYLFDARSGSYREGGGKRPGAHAWPISQAIAATIALARLPRADPGIARGARRRVEPLQGLRAGAVFSASAGGRRFFEHD